VSAFEKDVYAIRVAILILLSVPAWASADHPDSKSRFDPGLPCTRAGRALSRGFSPSACRSCHHHRQQRTGPGYGAIAKLPFPEPHQNGDVAAIPRVHRLRAYNTALMTRWAPDDANQKLDSVSSAVWLTR